MATLASGSAVRDQDAIPPVRRFLWVVWATVRNYNLQFASNTIQLIRGPTGAVLGFLAIMLVYRISGQTAVDKDDVLGFLLTGEIAVFAWGSTVWACGFGLQMEAHRGTLGPVFVSPASRIAVVTGYGLGGFAFSLPSVICLLLVGFGFGARLDIDSPALALVSLAAVYVSALCIGIACGGLFILSRQANSLANFLQAPVYILAGFYFPRSVLPDWIEPIATILPIAHAVDALRAAVLNRAGWQDTAPELLATLAGCVVFLLIGIWSLRRVEHAVRGSGDLNLF